MLLSILSLAFAEQVAVLEFTGSGDENLIGILSDQARAGALDQLDPLQYSILTRENMMQILEDMGKDATCIGGSCEVELARNIGADLVISGTITALGDVQVVMLKLHRSDTGALLAMEKVQGSEPVALVEETFRAAKSLLRTGLKLQIETHRVEFSSTPHATVRVDGQVLCEETPCVREVEGGKHAFEWSAEGVQSVQETLLISKSQTLYRDLKSNQAMISVLGVPKGIQVDLDGENWKETPIQAVVSPGTHQLTLDDDCYEMETVEFSLRAGQTYSWSLQPTLKSMDFSMNARNMEGESVFAQVYADDVLVGSTQQSFQIPICTEMLRVDGGKEGVWQGKVQLASTQSRLSVALQNAQTAIQTEPNSLFQPGASIDYPMVNVSVGRFWMGSTNNEVGRNRDEQQHQVMLTQPFAIGTTEVTQRLWQTVTGNNPSQNRSCSGECPVENINWCDAVLFANQLSRLHGYEAVYQLPSGFVQGLDTNRCNMLAPAVQRKNSANGYRLPTEAEWEWSAREMSYYVTRSSSSQMLTESHRYSGSSTIGRVGWYEDNSRRTTHSVCTKDKNLLELCDMSGNVFEWVEDWYGADTSMFSNTDPRGPSSGETKVLRGGSYLSPKNVLRNAFRYNTAPGYRDGQMGLRLVRNL